MVDRKVMINLLLELYRSLRGLPRPEVPETIGEDNKVPIFYDTSVLDRCELYRSHQVMRKLGMDWLYKEHTWYKVPPIHVYDIRRRNLRNNGTDIDTLLQDNDRMDDAELDIVDTTRIVIDECSSEISKI